jgi:hypothetical protein
VLIKQCRPLSCPMLSAGIYIDAPQKLQKNFNKRGNNGKCCKDILVIVNKIPSFDSIINLKKKLPVVTSE